MHWTIDNSDPLQPCLRWSHWKVRAEHVESLIWSVRLYVRDQETLRFRAANPKLEFPLVRIVNDPIMGLMQWVEEEFADSQATFGGMSYYMLHKSRPRRTLLRRITR